MEQLEVGGRNPLQSKAADVFERHRAWLEEQHPGEVAVIHAVTEKVVAGTIGPVAMRNFSAKHGEKPAHELFAFEISRPI